MGIFAGLNADEPLIIKRLAIIFTMFWALNSSAQSNDMGIFLGKGLAFTDVGLMGQVKSEDNAFGVFYRRNFNPYWSLRANLQYGQISAGDSNSTEAFVLNRNLSFRNRIWDANVWMEFNFFNFSHHKSDNQHTPYIFAGLGYTLHNPQAFYQGEWVDLRPLGTEGQNSDLYPDRKPYAKGLVTIPVGVGYKVLILKRVSLGLEAGFRKTFTDYLDDVSISYPDPAAFNSNTAAALSDRSLDQENHANYKRGNPNTKDWFGFAGFTLIVQLRRHHQSCAQF